MKKKIIGAIAVVAIAALAAFNMNMNTENNEISGLSMDNVEALAEYESTTSCSYNCWFISSRICYMGIDGTFGCLGEHKMYV